MEQILRSKKLAEITWIPVRHHSPACAFHLKKMIEIMEPDCILIEGPENANELIPVMIHEDTKAPFAIYYSYRDKSGYVSEEKEDYKCYYPFLDYSPELIALREGKISGIETAFIDLSYGEILIACQQGKGLLKKAEKTSYNDDYLLARSRFIKELCERTGLRSFDEFWEKYFEINGIYQDSQTFFNNMAVYCELSRQSSSQEELEAEGCLQREKYMAAVIREYQMREDINRIIVVTGGFHTSGLKALLKGEDKEILKPKLHKIWQDQGVYLMPYSMEAADALNGYASGMIHPGFYQNIWENLLENREKPYDSAVLSAIVAAGRRVRKKEGYLSSYDEICAYSMAGGLAELRGKREPGAFETEDAVLSSFVKGEYSLSTSAPMSILQAYMTGEKTGSLCKEAAVPPIVTDFENQCSRFALKTYSTLEQELILEIFSKEKHRQNSIFFSRLDYLKTGFARKTKGPDLRRKKDRNLIREIWKYKWSANVTSSLIDISVYGGTIEEACTSLVLLELKKNTDSCQAVELFIRVFEMDLRQQLPGVYEKMEALLKTDSSFISLAKSLSHLKMLEEMSELYDTPVMTDTILKMCCERLCMLLPLMAQVKEEEAFQIMEACKLLYQITSRIGYEDQKELLMQAFWQLLASDDLNSSLDGCVHGILYGAGEETASDIEGVLTGYLTGTREQMLKTASYLKGLFYTARDLVFAGEYFLKMIDTFLRNVENDTFMELLPELRLAFSYFTPREVDRIAEGAAGLYGTGKKELFQLKEVSLTLYEAGKELDSYVRSRMEDMQYGHI